ncbi:hypothetical protein SAMN05216412_106190 [Nitrosospira multiformis]|uniref:Uncharacterized protein n=1 Tax=Nitrosospira multiformis TaxID=1231 RepID=A0A1I0EGP7_9PROT|nr:hypothetical protein [Nitrosospira multiformis]SET44509.1 hypothetical protein SAMN05216412_106190 [Nitrosospira multiformis]
MEQGENREVFASLCQFLWMQGHLIPLIYDLNHEVYSGQGITLPALKALEATGLISVSPAGYVKKGFGQHTRLFYFGRPTKIRFLEEAGNQLDLGHVLLTDKGKARAQAVVNCDVQSNQLFYEYVVEKWLQQGLVVSSILRKQ